MKPKEMLLTELGGIRLRMELDRVPLWRGMDVELQQLAQDFAQYLYLPRLRNPEVLVEAVKDGVSSLSWRTETFAYAERKDEKSGRYSGLRCGENALISPESRGLIVQSNIAAAQRETESTTHGGARATGSVSPASAAPSGLDGLSGITAATDNSTTASKSPQLPNHFYGTVEVDPRRLGRDAGRIAEEVVSHLLGLDGSSVKVTIEIQADVMLGVPQNIVRAVTENCRTLAFRTHGFEGA